MSFGTRYFAMVVHTQLTYQDSMIVVWVYIDNSND